MAQFVVRNLEEDVAEKLKQRAKRHARSMEDEVRHILRTAVQQREPAQKLGTRIARRFRGAGLRGSHDRRPCLDSPPGCHRDPRHRSAPADPVVRRAPVSIPGLVVVLAPPHRAP